MNMNLRPKRRPVPTIPIVSLIDILVILLIFFIATSTFRKQKTHLQIALPQSKGMGGATTESHERLAISITPQQEIFLDGKPVAVENLAQALATLKGARPGAKLELEADTTSQLGVIVKVWDALRSAGFSISDVPARIQRSNGGP